MRILRSEQAFEPRRTLLSGFWRQFVGLFVGFLGLPDNGQASGINKLGAKCRVCRVFIGVERTQEFKDSTKTDVGRTQSIETMELE